MKSLMVWMLAFVVLQALEYRGDIAMEQAWYQNRDAQKRTEQSSLYADLQLGYALGALELTARLEALRSGDERRYLLLNELALRYRFDAGELLGGKNIRFWGALEAYNITDTFNTKNVLFAPYTPFEKERKYGSWNVSYRHFLEEGSVEMIVKLKEEEQPMGGMGSPYALFPYQQELLYEKRSDRPTVFLKSSGTLDDTALDYAFVLQYGYDNRRTLQMNETEKMQQRVRSVTKFSTYETLALGDTLFKFEASVARNSEGGYYHAGAGIEQTFYAFAAGADLSLFLEYYKSNMHNPLERYQDDLFSALRLNMNDAASTQWTVGMIKDTDYGDVMFQSEFKRRLYAGWNIKLMVLYIDADKVDSPNNALDAHSSLRAALQWYF